MKLYFFTILFFICTSCQKEVQINSQVEKLNLNQKTEFNSIISNESFKKLYMTFSRNLILIEKVKKDSNNKLADQIRIELSKSIALFLIQNPIFMELNNADRIRAFDLYKQKFKNDFYFKSQNPNIDTSSTVDYLSGNNFQNLEHGFSSDFISRVSNEEFIGCVLETIGGAIASYGDAINDIRRLISYGFSGRLLLDATMDIISSASPWWKVAGLTISFGACIYSAYD